MVLRMNDQLNRKNMILHHGNFMPFNVRVCAYVYRLVCLIDNRHHWHNDISSLTGVVGAMYIDSDGKEIDSPDGDHGIYVKTRGEGGDNRERVIHIPLPSEYMYYRIGETMQIHSGGALQSTPHCVRACSLPTISRIGFEV